MESKILLRRLVAVGCLALAMMFAAGLVFSPFIGKVNAASSVGGSFTVALTISDVSVSNIGYHSATISWTQAASPDANVDFVLTEEASSTWDRGTCIEPATLASAFEFKFTVGKVATETTGTAKWQIAAKVTDDSDQSNTWGATSFDADYSDMVWYGEISGVSGSVDWGTVNPGMAIAEDTSSEESLGGTTKYIANGIYDAKVSSSTLWTAGGEGDDATLDEDGGTLANNNFSLKADDDAELTDAVFVTNAGATINAAVAQTEEAGDDVTTNTLWLQLAETFIKDTYTGTITYIIATDS